MINNLILSLYKYNFFTPNFVIQRNQTRNNSTSAKGTKRLSSYERSIISLTDFTRQALIGLLLGDMHIQRRTPTANSRLVYAQSDKHLPYLLIVFSLFTGCFTVNYVTRVSSIVTLGITYTAHTFVTMALVCFNYYHSLFYVNGVKIVPINIEDLLTPVGLAFWIIDDGSRQNIGLHLNTYGFSEEEVSLLINVLTNKFHLKCSKHSHRKGSRIYIWQESMPHLRTLVSPYMHSTMLYKIGL
jgi:hypothetical protein